MTDEAALLAAIADRPGDPLPRLVYADWLDDRGDGRAELVRVEEEMRTLPADADRYWALKPRRNELRAGCSPDWLVALGYGRPNPTAFAEWPTDFRGRWRFVREFVEQRFELPMPDAGGRLAEVDAVERRLDRPLPAAVREWVAFRMDIEEPFEVRLRDDPPLLELAEDPDVGRVYGVPPEDLDRDDPPVRGYYWDVNYSVDLVWRWWPGPWGPFDSAAAFALSLNVFSQRPAGEPFDPTAEVREELRRWVV